MSVRVTAGYAGLFGLCYVALSLWVVRARQSHRVALGSGGVPALERRIRVHANFSEYVPFTLLLAALAELQGLGALPLHFIAVALLAGRALHAWAVAQPWEPTGRVPGMVLTLGSLGTASCAAIYSCLFGQ